MFSLDESGCLEIDAIFTLSRRSDKVGLAMCLRRFHSHSEDEDWRKCKQSSETCKIAHKVTSAHYSSSGWKESCRSSQKEMSIYLDQVKYRLEEEGRRGGSQSSGASRRKQRIRSEGRGRHEFRGRN